jgi:hypothetical protein
LGFEEIDWVPEAKVEFFPGRTGDIDLLVRIGDRPLIVVEAEPTAHQFDQASNRGVPTLSSWTTRLARCRT